MKEAVIYKGKSKKVALAVAGLACTALLLAGCGGPPDISGEWTTEVTLGDDDEPSTLTLDLEQNAEDELDGSVTLAYEVIRGGENPTEETEAPITSGDVSEDGSFELQAGQGYQPLRITGDAEGDELVGEAFLGGEQYSVTFTQE